MELIKTGTELHQARRALRLTQTKAAIICQCSRNTWAAWERADELALMIAMGVTYAFTAIETGQINKNTGALAAENPDVSA